MNSFKPENIKATDVIGFMLDSFAEFLYQLSRKDSTIAVAAHYHANAMRRIPRQVTR